ncbi:MAG: ABC transporter permease [Chloroflexi bacterium]|nr:MAG: ABC transporter permease [Chloroflexota bacterium]
MGTYLARRLLLLIPVIFGVTVVVFGMMHLAPGDPAVVMAGPRATPEILAEVRRYLGLDQPLVVQYFTWVGHALQGDLGRSIRQGEQVSTLVLARFHDSVLLGLTAFGVASTIGISVGVLSALHRGSLVDRAVMLVSMLGVSTPAFFLGMVLTGPFDVARHLILPALTLAAPSMTVIARVVRASVLETVGRDYVGTAQAKGLHDFAVVSQHILKNALIPVITLLGLQVGFLLGGAAIVEVVFSYPGIGNLMVKSIVERDLPVTQGCVLLIASVYVLVNIGADVLQAYLDPRIRVT